MAEEASPGTTGDLDVVDAALAGVLGDLAGPGQEGLTRAELAEQAGVPESVLEAIEREGLLQPRGDGGARYTSGDRDAVAAGLDLLEAGLPLGELLALGRRLDAALREVADHAVEVFLDYVRDPALAGTDSPEEAAEQVVEAVRLMLPATTRLVGHHFEGVLLERARSRLAERRHAEGGR